MGSRHAGSATEIAAAVLAGRLSAVDVVDAALARAAASQPALNAFTSIDVDGARRRAEQIDRRIASGVDVGPLAGVPVAIKDLIDQAGVPNTKGGSFPPTVPTRSAPVVERLEAAGAVIIGRTGLHEFAFGYTSENEWFGPVRNPWDPALSPGGSSGGSGAAVAAGVVPVAIGTDTGGSVRVPAALCGVVGLKVSHGRVPLRGVYPLAASLDTVGPLTRSVEDAASMFAVIAGDDPEDPWSAPHPVEPFTGPVPIAGLRVGVPMAWMDVPTTASVKAAFERALAALEEAGAIVSRPAVPELELDDAARSGAYVEVASVHRDRYLADPSRYGAAVASRIAESIATPADALVGAIRWRAGARHALDRVFADVDVLVTPTVGATRKVIGVDTIDVDGVEVFHRTVLASYAAPVNGVGLPAVALPLPGDVETPPASLQIIGPAFAETRLLEVAAALERAGIVEVGEPPLWFGNGERP